MLRCALATVLAAALLVPAMAQARTTIVYDDQAAAARVFAGLAGDPVASVLRQEPGRGGAFAGGEGRRRIAKINDEELHGRSAAQMAAILKREIDAPDEGEANAHIVAVDEIGNHFRDVRATRAFKTVVVRGKRYRIAVHNDIEVTRKGWRLRKRTPPAPRPRAHDPGVRFSKAMEILARTPSPYGGSYASRVHVYLAPALVTSIGEGRGRHFTLGRSGSTHIRAGWRGLFPGLARAGGVWLQMYHGDGGSVRASVWRRAPGRIAGYLARFGGERSRVHLVFTGSRTAPAGAGNCGSPMRCQWALASRGATRAILENGPGAYRLGADADEWVAGYRAAF